MWPQQFISSLLLNFVSKEVCYEGYGCFSNSPPYDVSLALLPQDPIYLNTTYHVHTREQGKLFPILQAPFNDLQQNIKNKPRTFIVTHGFIEHSRKFWVRPMVDALLKHSDSNVIFVDWENGAAYPFNQAFGDSRVVAVEIAKLVEMLHQQRILNVNTVHLIGFSLGAHMMGRVGHILKHKGLMVDRITGLDPAGPPFENCHHNVSLDKTDATFVDVIHSDASTPLLGTLKRQGHVDFYPNGGLLQPGCKRVTTDVFSQKKMFDYVSCSHYRSILYFIHSINNPHAFKAFKCQSYSRFLAGECHDANRLQHMGFHVKEKKRGAYYLVTRKQSPFAGHNYHIRLKTSSIPYSSFGGIIKFIIHGTKASSNVITFDRDIHTSGSTAYLTFAIKKKLGDVRNIAVKASSGAWFQDKWLLSHISLRRLGGKRWHGCSNKWIGADNFVIVKFDGKKCPKKQQPKVVEMLIKS